MSKISLVREVDHNPRKRKITPLALPPPIRWWPQVLLGVAFGVGIVAVAALTVYVLRKLWGVS
jgi:hypothetical protein